MFLYLTLFLILFENIRCDDYIFGVIQDVNATCSITQDCSRRFGGSERICSGGICVCKSDFYESDGSCLKCSGFQESCEVSQCCLFSRISSCMDNVCRCKYNSDIIDFSSCWRHTQGKQNILSFAKLLLGAILALSLASLFGILRQLCNRPDVIESSTGFQRGFPYESFNSIQRYVMQKLKDRPPRYEDIQKENGAGPSPSSSHPRSGRSHLPGSRGTLPPAYQALSTPSSSMDLTIPPPPYSASPEDLFTPPEPYTRRSLESTPLVFQIAHSGGVRNQGYQATETVPNTGAAQDPLASMSQACSGQNGASQGIYNQGYNSIETDSNTNANATKEVLPFTSQVFRTEISSKAAGAPTDTSDITASQLSSGTNSPPGTSKLPSYSELEILLSPKSMNEHYMSLQQKPQTVEVADNEGMEYQVGSDMVIVSQVVDTEKLNVVDGKLCSAVSREVGIVNPVTELCQPLVISVEDIQDERSLAVSQKGTHIAIPVTESSQVSVEHIQDEKNVALSRETCITPVTETSGFCEMSAGEIQEKKSLTLKREETTISFPFAESSAVQGVSESFEPFTNCEIPDDPSHLRPNLMSEAFAPFTNSKISEESMQDENASESKFNAEETEIVNEELNGEASLVRVTEADGSKRSDNIETRTSVDLKNGGIVENRDEKSNEDGDSRENDIHENNVNAHGESGDPSSGDLSVTGSSIKPFLVAVNIDAQNETSSSNDVIVEREPDDKTFKSVEIFKSENAHLEILDSSQSEECKDLDVSITNVNSNSTIEITEDHQMVSDVEVHSPTEESAGPSKKDPSIITEGCNEDSVDKHSGSCGTKNDLALDLKDNNTSLDAVDSTTMINLIHSDKGSNSKDTLS